MEYLINLGILFCIYGVLALAENVGVWFFASQWRDLIAFVIFILLLWLRPNGIFVRAPKKVSCEFKLTNPKGSKK